MKQRVKDFISFNKDTLVRRYGDMSKDYLKEVYRSIDHHGMTAENPSQLADATVALSNYLDMIEVLALEHGRNDLSALALEIMVEVQGRSDELSHDPEVQELLETLVGEGGLEMLAKMVAVVSGGNIEDVTDAIQEFGTRALYLKVNENPEQYVMPYLDLPKEVIKFFDWIETVWKATLFEDVTTHAYRISTSELGTGDDDPEDFIFLTVKRADKPIFSTAAPAVCVMDGEHFKDDHQVNISGEILKLISQLREERS